MIRKLLHESWGKAIVGVLSAIMLGAFYFVGGVVSSWYSSIVFADEMAAAEERIAATVAPIEEALTKIIDDAQRRQDEWRCSELEEELQDYYDRQEAGQAYTQRDIDRMERIKERMGVENLNCVRFED